MTSAFSSQPMEWPKNGEDLMASLLETKSKFDALRREELRGWSEAIEKSKCPKCGHKPTLTNSGSGDTLEICDSMMAAIRKKCVAGDGAVDPLRGIFLRVSECHPRPPLQ